MDCEKFDRVVLDLFYEELDEITTASARRHMEHCTRCRDIGLRIRATREIGALPLVEPPDGLEQRILHAERRARKELPARQRFGRAISVLAGYAMRPQLAMAALLLLVIGSSLVLLRARPGEQKTVLVTERGVPESEQETVAIVPRRDMAAASAAPRELEHRESARAERGAVGAAPAAAAPGAAKLAEAPAEAEESRTGSAADGADRAYEQALEAYRDRKYEDAQRRFEDVAGRGSDNAPSAALYAAQSSRARSGCPAAAPLFEQVHQRYPDTPSGQEAAWQAAGCYRTLGDFERARHHYEALLQAPGYGDRAQAALSSLGDAEPVPEIAARRATSAGSAPAKPAAKARPAPKPAAPLPANP